MTALPGSGSFMIVPVEHVAEYGPAAAIVLARITWRAERDGAWTATRQTIAAETGLPLRTVRAALDLLRERSCLDAEQGKGYDRTTTWRPVAAGQAQGAGSVTCMMPDLSLGSDESGTFQVTESALSSLETVETEETPSQTPADDQPALPLLTVVPTAGEQPAHFARFWDLYPRKVGKPKAQQAFARALRRTTVEAIAAGLRAHLPAWEARIAAEGSKTFVPHPTSWLNRDGWEDEPPALPTARRGASWSDPDDLAGAEAMLQRWKVGQ